MLAALAFALGASTAARAEVPVQTCIAALDRSAGLAERLGAAPTTFNCDEDQTRFGSGDFAARLNFEPVANDPANPLVLRLGSVWQDSARVIFRYGDGTSESLNFTSGNAAFFLSIGANLELPVPVHRAPLTTVHIETVNSANLRGVVLDARLMTRSEAAESNSWMIALYAAFAGMCLAMIAYNLSLFAVLRYRFQLFYSARVVLVAAYAFTASGAAMLLWPGLDSNDRLRFNTVLLSLAGVFGLRFINSFFASDDRRPGLRRYVDAVTAFAVVASLAYCLLAPWRIQLLERTLCIALAMLMAGVVPIIHGAYKRGNRYVPIFLLAWSAPLLAAFARLAHGLDLTDTSFWQANGALVAFAMEMLLSSLMIVMRLRELNQERDMARANEQSALRMANSDPLTRLLNRRAFLELALGSKGQFRLMVLDLDHFKAINDRSGHDFGDDVLRRVAQIIQGLRPRGSLAVRMGGEEFALLVPMEHEAECRPAQVLAAVRELELPLGARVTASMGVAEGTIMTEQDWRRLYRLADAALYRAKADGRDRICRATDFTRIAAA